jgi:hypothetical protein
MGDSSQRLLSVFDTLASSSNRKTGAFGRKMSVLDDLDADLEIAGLEPGTPEFEVAKRRQQVAICQDLRGEASCFTCSAYLNCVVAKAHLRDERERAYAIGVRQGMRNAQVAKDLETIQGVVEDE